MSRSHTSVRPLAVAAPPSPSRRQPQAAADIIIEQNNVLPVPPTRIRMKDIQGMPGTSTSLALRFLQISFAVVSLALMVTTSHFPSVTAFRYLVAAMGLQTLWSLSLGVVDIYALSVKRCLRNSRVVTLFTMGDGITSMLTFAAACASAGITVLFGNDFGSCDRNNCTQFETATAMAFMSWFAISPSFFLNFWSLAST